MIRSLAPIALALAICAGACGNGANGVDACKAIEDARCRQVPNCPNIQVSPPVYYTTGTAVDACIRFYDTACLHGLAIGTEPANADVNACVAAIGADGCGVVAAPETDPACAWLEPPDGGSDGGDGGEGGDDGGDSASDAAEGGDDSG